MMLLFKGLSRHVSDLIQKMIIVAIMVYVITLSAVNTNDFLVFIQGVIPLLLLAFAFYILTSKQQLSYVHLILFLFLFSNGVGDWVRMVFSYNFSTQTFTTSFSFQLLMSFLISLYLIAMSISYALNQQYKIVFYQHKVLLPLSLLVVYLYVRFGFGTALFVMLPVMFAYFSKEVHALLFVILYVVAQVPFQLIELMVNSRLRFTNITYWLTSILAMVIVVWVVLMALRRSAGET